MALPYGFASPTEYFKECLIFLRKYQHLFNFPNTDLLLRNVLDKIDIDCLDDFDIFADDFEISKIRCSYLLDFYENLSKLKVKYEEFVNKDLEFLIDVPLSVKKKHEIAYLAEEIDLLCKETQCNTVVDFGSGLGYLDQQIFKKAGYNVLGIECNESHYVGAKKRQRKYHSDSIERVKYVKHSVTEDSYTNINEYIQDKFPSCNGFCITGLHACADLTIDAINIFLKMEKAKSLIIMPCCYHRIFKDESCKFKNFPLSDALKDLYDEYSGADLLTVPFLRLATQPQNICKEKMEDLVFNLLARAVLQVYSLKHNCRLKRNKRKTVRLKSIGNNFEEYVQDAIIGYTLIKNEIAEENKRQEFDKEYLYSIWRKIPQETFNKTAIFILLQNDLQPMFENFVLYDRLLYLQEKGIRNCKFKKIVNEKISPRCLALLAQK
ncbi:unnamed protein product [Euphydryas editha]|uniref:Methyltransferase domain-containing protein n=1 Tax=Euphydryas editha TaxID=104508 RepID=A0AAU9TCY4_EUPED|nr:unnamed protein product [Euphydryas editha]